MIDRNLPEEKIQCYITLTETQQKKLDWLCSPPPAFLELLQFDLQPEQFFREAVLTAVLMDFFVFADPSFIKSTPSRSKGKIVSLRGEWIQFDTLAQVPFSTYQLLRGHLSEMDRVFCERNSDEYSKIISFQLEQEFVDHIAVGFMLQCMNDKIPLLSISNSLMRYYMTRKGLVRSEDNDLEGVAE